MLPPSRPARKGSQLPNFSQKPYGKGISNMPNFSDDGLVKWRYLTRYI